MERMKIESSNVVSAGYDPNTKILEVEFKGGGVYEYQNVPSGTWEGFQRAESKGSFIHRNIKPVFKFQKKPI